MKEGIDKKLLMSNWHSLVRWADKNLFSSNALIELITIAIVIVVAFIIAKLLKKLLDNVTFENTIADYSFKLFKKHLFGLLFPTILLILVPVFKLMALKTYILYTVGILAISWVGVHMLPYVMRNKMFARFIALVVWTSAALSIFGVYGNTVKILDSMFLKIGDFKLSLYLLIKGAFILGVFFWAASMLSSMSERKLAKSRNLTPTLQVLSGKILKIVLYLLALTIGLSSIGIDLTAFAVFSGAVGVGVGFGLQKIVSNIVSGFIVLMDDSIKPGDVIQLDDEFGTVVGLRARYISVIAWDGKEYLIPNEDIVTGRVINWTHSSKNVLVLINVGVSYNSDVHKVKELLLKAVEGVDRVRTSPAPMCDLLGFGDSSVDFRLAVWISDPENGLVNLKSEIYFRIWDLFKEHNIEIPFPQRDLHIKSGLMDVLSETEEPADVEMSTDREAPDNAEVSAEAVR